MNQEKQYSDPLPRRLSSDPLKQETDWTDERPDFAAQAKLIRHVQAASPPSPLLAVQRKSIPALSLSSFSSVAQFTWADAQELWVKLFNNGKGRWPTKKVILSHIERKQREWMNLEKALRKPGIVPPFSHREGWPVPEKKLSSGVRKKRLIRLQQDRSARQESSSLFVSPDLSIQSLSIPSIASFEGSVFPPGGSPVPASTSSAFPPLWSIPPIASSASQALGSGFLPPIAFFEGSVFPPGGSPVPASTSSAFPPLWSIPPIASSASQALGSGFLPPIAFFEGSVFPPGGSPVPASTSSAFPPLWSIPPIASSASQALGSGFLPPIAFFEGSVFPPGGSPVFNPIFEGKREEEIDSINSGFPSDQSLDKNEKNECGKIRHKMIYSPLKGKDKVKTDIRRYEQLEELLAHTTGYGEARMALNLFFHKNAPLGYNRHEADRPVYDLTYERDYSFGKPASSSLVTSSRPSYLLDERKSAEYARTAKSHPPFFEGSIDSKAKNIFWGETCRDERKVYLAFEKDLKEIGIRFREGYIFAPSSQHFAFLGVRGPKRISGLKRVREPKRARGAKRVREPKRARGAKRVTEPKKFEWMRINRGGQDLILWVNGTSAGRQSLYNAAGMVPNMIQCIRILRKRTALKPGKNKTDDPKAKMGRVFEESIREVVLRNIPEEIALPRSYKANMLKDRRELMIHLSRQVNSIFSGSVLAVIRKEESGFLPYPCLILEPLKKDKEDREPLKKRVENLKETLAKTIHSSRRYPISLANRNSFGFAYPTISDVGDSVRIWPGLIPAHLFEEIIIKALSTIFLPPDVSSTSSPSSLDSFPQPSPYVSRSEPSFTSSSSSDTSTSGESPLRMALMIAQVRAKKRFATYDSMKDLLENHEEVRFLYHWVNNRIVANLIKADALIKRLGHEPYEVPHEERDKELDEVMIVNRAVRILENLNEYDLIQASAEEELRKLRSSTEERTQGPKELITDLASTLPRIAGYSFVTMKILNSGMAAFRVALLTIGDAKHGNRIYFEEGKLTSAVVRSAQDKVEPPSGQITRMQDPSYNFVSEKDRDNRHPAYKWEEAATSSLPTVHLYDITNTSLVEAAALSLAKEAPDLLVFVESLSKHFQLGMDKTTLGRLIVYKKSTVQDFRVPGQNKLIEQFEGIEDTPLPDFFLNYIEMQSRLFGV